VLRHFDTELHLLGNLHILVNFTKCFPHVFKHVKIKDHSSIAIFDPMQNTVRTDNVERLYERLLLDNKYLLFSQEGMTMCTLVSNQEDDFQDISDPLLLKEMFTRIRKEKMNKECRKDNITTVFGNTRIYADNICDLYKYCKYVNPDFDQILFYAFEDIEESKCKE